MDINDREKYWAAAEIRAREIGGHYVVRSCPEFNTNIMACVWCDWTDTVGDNWMDDADAQVSILAHARTHQKDGKSD